MSVAGADAVLADGNRGDSASGGCSVISVRLARSPQGQQVSSPLLLLPLLPIISPSPPFSYLPVCHPCGCGSGSTCLRFWSTCPDWPWRQTTWLWPRRSSYSSSLSWRSEPAILTLYTETLSVVYFIVHLQQLMRYFRMWPGGEGLHASLLPLLDSQDSGPLLLSHLYLLLGFSLPLWVTPFRQYGHGELQCTLQTYIHWYTTSIS